MAFDVRSAGVTDGSVILVPRPSARGTWVCRFPAYDCRRVTRARGPRHVLFGARDVLMDFGGLGAALVDPDSWAIRYLDDPHGAIRNGDRHVQDSRLIQCPSSWAVIRRHPEVRGLDSPRQTRHTMPPLDRPFLEEVGDRTLLFSRYGERAHDPCSNTPVSLPDLPGRRRRYAWIRLPGARGVTSITPLTPTALPTAGADDAGVTHRYRYQRGDASTVLTMPTMAGAGMPVPFGLSPEVGDEIGFEATVAAGVHGDALWLFRATEQAWEVTLWRSPPESRDTARL